MNLLLDTCTLIWAAGEPSRLSATAQAALLDADNQLLLSAISGFEVGLLHRLRQIQIAGDPLEWFERAVQRFRIGVVPVTWQLALSSTQLPQIHRDPADRIIVVTAQQEDATVVTPDPHISQYPQVKTLW